MSDNVLSTIARGPQGETLVQFAHRHGISDTWTFPDGTLSTMLTGNKLDNNNGATFKDYNNSSPFRINNEILLHLGQDKDSIIVNLATVLALATAYCRNQQRLARKVINAIKKDHKSAKLTSAARARGKSR